MTRPIVAPRLGRGFLSAMAALSLAVIMLFAAPARATTPTYATDYVWDAGGRLVMVISPDPGTGVRPAVKYTYDPDGEVTQVDKGTTTNATGSDFSAQERVTNTYDAVGNKLVVAAIDPTTSTTLTVAQTAYDPDDRALCSAQRMNPASFASLPADGCTLGTAGSYGQDRINRTTYDAAGQKLVETRAYGVPGLQEDYATYAYSPNGKMVTEKDANGNLTTLEYDGLDRLVKMDLPSTTLAAGTSSTTDYETYGYDANGNRLSLRKRDGRYLSWCYDGLNREVTKYVTQTAGAVTCTLNVTTGVVTASTAPASVDVATAYDLLSRRASVGFAGGSISVAYGYDPAGRLLTETTAGRQISYQYDAAGNRTRVTWPDSVYVTYAYDALNHLTQASDSASNSLVTPGYDGLGRRTAMARGNGTSAGYGFDNADRLTSLGQDLSGTASDLTLSFVYNPASQVLSRGVSNTAYDWATPPPATTNKAYDGLNRDAAIVASSGYDANGNLTNDGARAFTYDIENRLLTASAPTAVTLSYDPLGRLQQTVAGSTTTTFLYDGDRLTAEYNGSTLLRRYVHGTGIDEPLVWYEGAGTTDRRWLHADNQGSIVAWSNTTGAMGEVYTYGPYGEPGASNWGGSRFRYTGQIVIPEAQLYYYKARVYDPMTGRLLQTDPVGYKDDLDLYAYVAEDPVNRGDPSGTMQVCQAGGYNCPNNGGGWLRFPNYDSGAPSGRPPAMAEGFDFNAALASIGLKGAQPPQKAAENRSGWNEGAHYYGLHIPLCDSCTKGEAFDGARNFTAPGAPRAQDGRHTRILSFGNPIAQVVDPDNFSITNITLKGHWFFPGTVNIKIVESNGVKSMDVVGEGVGKNRLQNQILGPMIFTGMAISTYLNLHPLTGQEVP